MPSLLVPYLMAPFWLVGNVGRAYHLVVASGGVVFSAAVFPAYVLARRIGISPNGALFVALFAVLVPDAAFATCALTESYAYPLFLLTMLLSVDAIARPTRRRQAIAVVSMAALCLVRVQLLVFPLAFLLALFLQGNRSLRHLWRHPAVVGAAIVAVVGGVAATRGFYSGIGGHWSAIGSMGPWLALNLFVLAIASGWVLVPGAIVGFLGLVKSAEPWARTFGVLALCTIGLIVLEAAYYDAILPRVHERYTFYAVPLLAAACVFGLQSMPEGRAYSLAAYTMAALAIVLPATASFRNADPSQAPALLALQDIGSGGARLAWAIPLSLIAIAIAQLRHARWAPLAVGAVIAAGLCADGTRVLLSYEPVAHPGGTRNIDLYELHAPVASALVTWAGTDKYVLMKTLFWTPTVDRVLVLGGGPAADGFGSQPVSFGRRGIVDKAGKPVSGPFAFDLQTTVLATGASASSTKWLWGSPEGVALGLNRKTGDLSTATRILFAPSQRPRELSLALRSDAGEKRLVVDCAGRKFRVWIGRTAVPVRVSIPPSTGVRRCRISLIRGSAVERDGAIVSGVRVARLALRQATPS